MQGYSRRIPGRSPLCSLCEVEEETELHCLRDRVIARLIWDASEWGEEIKGNYPSFGEMWSGIVERLPWEVIGTIMVTLWAVWEPRNRWIFEGGSLRSNTHNGLYLKSHK